MQRKLAPCSAGSWCVSIPQAVIGCMQLYSVCILTKLAPASRAFAKCSYDVSRSPCGTSPQNGVLVKKRHFRSFLPFSNMDIVLFFVKNIGSPLAPQEVWMSTSKSVRFLWVGEVFSLLHTIYRHIYFTRIQPLFQSLSQKNCRSAFAFSKQSKFCQKTKKRDWRRKISSCNSPFL